MEHVEIKKTVNPQVDVKQDHIYECMMSIKNKRERSYTASSITNNTISWSTVTPSPGSGILRHIKFELAVEITLEVTNLATGARVFCAPNIPGSVTNCGIRQHPIQSACIINFTINNHSLSSDLKNSIHALSRFNSPEMYKYKLEASAPDFTYLYNNAAISLNPFSNVGNSVNYSSRTFTTYAEADNSTPNMPKLKVYIYDTPDAHLRPVGLKSLTFGILTKSSRFRISPFPSLKKKIFRSRSRGDGLRRPLHLRAILDALSTIPPSSSESMKWDSNSPSTTPRSLLFCSILGYTKRKKKW